MKTYTKKELKKKFRELCGLEPRLLEMEKEIKSIKDTGGTYFCANDIWYEQFKPKLKKLVGWYAQNSQLRTEEAYDVAYDYLYDLLPPCRNCFCCHTEAILLASFPDLKEVFKEMQKKGGRKNEASSQH